MSKVFLCYFAHHRHHRLCHHLNLHGFSFLRFFFPVKFRLFIPFSLVLHTRLRFWSFIALFSFSCLYFFSISWTKEHFFLIKVLKLQKKIFRVYIKTLLIFCKRNTKKKRIENCETTTIIWWCEAVTKKSKIKEEKSKKIQRNH